MAQFAFLYRGGDPVPDSPEQKQKRLQKWLRWFEDLKANGHIEDRGFPLGRAGTTIAGAERAITDGPYPEKDLVIGVTIVDARDLAHASELARACPVFEQGGCLEVRPILP
jgi:hypothetical protein